MFGSIYELSWCIYFHLPALPGTSTMDTKFFLLAWDCPSRIGLCSYMGSARHALAQNSAVIQTVSLALATFKLTVINEMQTLESSQAWSPAFVHDWARPNTKTLPVGYEGLGEFDVSLSSHIFCFLVQKCLGACPASISP